MASKLDVDPNYEKQVRKLRDHARAEYDARSVGNQVKWFRPDGWEGDPRDYEALRTPFSRAGVNDKVVSAMNPADPGTVGDVVAGATMVGVLSTMERAFTVRQTLRRTRGTAHHLARKQGQGSDSGTVVKLWLEYVRGVVRQSRAEA